jgi:hypothetical protein
MTFNRGAIAAFRLPWLTAGRPKPAIRLPSKPRGHPAKMNGR